MLSGEIALKNNHCYYYMMLFKSGQPPITNGRVLRVTWRLPTMNSEVSHMTWCCLCLVSPYPLCKGTKCHLAVTYYEQ